MRANYEGKPYRDAKHVGGPQLIPGKVMCAYYDLGGEGIAYHDATAINQGSGRLNPADGTYLNEFRLHEGVDTSYTKPGGIDDSAYNLVQPEIGMPYVGWTEPGEWMNYTVEVARAGIYLVHLLYASNRGGAVSLSVDGEAAAELLEIASTYDAEDEVEWRQWHHWNKAERLTVLHLEKGVQVLTLRTVLEGQMNYAYLEFELL
ncbi:carbohydrate-binding protein [Paenibacillus glycinis]|uniref:carbohydrate-binding protein n=1 Tax=Paenibacillus glycinis TaxID=2697035 RepID=UPI00191C0ECB|nr:carbohydrate-binding protein [Paenibacillus glycinis]